MACCLMTPDSNLKITNLRSQQQLPGANELNNLTNTAVWIGLSWSNCRCWNDWNFGCLCAPDEMCSQNKECLLVWHTVRCHYYPVSFLQSHHKIHPIACPLGWGMGCLLWVQYLIYILYQSPQWCAQYRVILDCIITTLECICDMYICHSHALYDIISCIILPL